MEKLTPAEKAIKTAKWATTMTKWHIGFVTNGKRIGSKAVRPLRRWQLVGFPGPGGRESAGIVDLIAIRKDHRAVSSKFKRGDLFEIILIQINGGGARWPSMADIKRMWNVGERYRARDVLIAKWIKGSKVEFFRLKRNTSDSKSAREKIDDPGDLFR